MAEFETYTISNVMPTGKDDPKYGTEFYVKFKESPDTFTLWYKTAPAEGTEVQGNIVDGKFKKYKAPYNGATESKTAYKKPYGAVQADKNDGMRQGMCINNAATFVNTMLSKQDTPASPEEWADLVFTHAQALYDKGNLAPKPEGVEITDEVKNVKNVFGIK